MKTKLMATLGALVLVAAAVTCTLVFSNNAGAQNADGYEYGYLVPVPRVASYDIETKGWAGSAEDKEYLAAHVFVYEEGASNHDRRLNSLRRVNELAGQGWELQDAAAGLLRRKK